MQGEEARTALAVFGQHLVDSHGQVGLDPNHTETGEIVQTLCSQCPPCGPGHITSVQCRIRTTVIFRLAIHYDNEGKYANSVQSSTSRLIK